MSRRMPPGYDDLFPKLFGTWFFMAIGLESFALLFAVLAIVRALEVQGWRTRDILAEQHTALLEAGTIVVEGEIVE